HADTYRRLEDTVPAGARPAHGIAEAPLEGLRGHVEAVGDPVQVGVVGVHRLTPLVPAMAVHVDPQGIAVREEPVHEAAMTLDDEIGLPEAALYDRVESQEPGRVNLGAGAIGQPGTKIFHELGHRDEAMPGLQVGIRANLVLIRLDVYPPDRRNGPHVAICAQETCQTIRRANS